MNNIWFDELLEAENSRRSFLKKSLFGFVTLGASGFFTSSCSKYPDLETPLKIFNNKESFVLEEISKVFISSDETGLPDPGKIKLVNMLDEFVSKISKESQKQLKLLLNAFEDYTFFFNGNIKRFTKMSYEEKLEYLQSWENSNIEFRQMAFSALRMLIMMNYYCKDETWDKIGYSGPYCTGGTSE